MTPRTIEQFAREIHLSVERLLEQLNNAGIRKSNPKDIINEEETKALLNYLKTLHGARDEGKVTLARKQATPVKNINNAPTSKTQQDKRNELIAKLKNLQKTTSHNSKYVTNVSIESIEVDTSIHSNRKSKWIKPESIEISNFKAISKISIPLADVTILVGPNGSGKSSILQGIHWAARAASYIPPRNQSEVVSFERLDYSPSSEPLKTAHKKELSSDRNTEPTTVTFNYQPNSESVASAATIKIWAARASTGISVHIEGGSAVTPFKQREELITAYIPGLAGLTEKETLLVQPLLRRQAAGGDAGGVLRNILFNIASRQPGELDNSAAIERTKQLNELIQIIHPSVSLEISFNDREDINIQAFFDDNRLSGTKQPLETAATGVLQAIQIFAYLILFKPKILLVDEPDAHLHPDKQERLIDALEQAARQFDVQIILTTHSPHIVRAASPATNLLWINDGEAIAHEEKKIRSLLGWGGLDKKILFFVEDEDDQGIRALLRQWPNLNRKISVCRCYGVDNLPGNSLLKGLLTSESVNVKIIIHRDRDFMTESEAKKWPLRYTEDGVHIWITTGSDTESYFCTADYLAALYDVPTVVAQEWITKAIENCKDTKKVFFDKRKVINRILYENGGSPASDNLWESLGECSPSTTLGKTLHRALKSVIKAAGHSEKPLDRFTIPSTIMLAPELKTRIEEALGIDEKT